jgi:HPr kinase/phosphorylase
MPGIRVRHLLSEDAPHLGLKCTAGERGLENEITVPRVQNLGLDLSSHARSFQRGRIHILGKSDIAFLNQVNTRKIQNLIKKLCKEMIPCLVIVKALTPPKQFLAAAEDQGVPVLSTHLTSISFIDLANHFLEEKLAPRTTVHGVLMDVYGVGLLIIGESGIGKSECALDLITRGHRLIADDIVEIREPQEDVLIGSSMDLGRHYIEVRGLGLINIKDLFGVSVVRHSARIDLVVAMERWKEGELYDRLGLEDENYDILGVKIPMVKLPVAPGRNLSILIEVASRSHLLKLRGHNSAKAFFERVELAMAKSQETDEAAKKKRR